MFEKPQYLTPDGYRRLSRSPSKDGSLKKEISDFLAYKNARKQLSADNGVPSLKNIDPNVARYLKIKQQPTISDNAAKLIALAIKGMLQSK